MIIEASKKEYTEIFERKFTHFCERSPVYLTFSILYEEVHVKDIVNDSNFIFSINESVPVEKFIGSIRDELKKKAYPRLIEEKVTTVDPPLEDLLNATREDKSFDEAFASLSRKVEEIEYIVDKINLRKNQLVIENTETKEQYLYQMKMPVVFFLKKKVRKENSPKEAFKSLLEEGKLLYKIERKS